MNENDKPSKRCIDEIHRIVEGKNRVQTETWEIKLDNAILKLDMKVKDAVVESIDKYFGDKQKNITFNMNVVKFFLYLAGLSAAVAVLKFG